MSLWVDIPKQFKSILDGDVTVQALNPTVRIGMPAKNIVDADYPVIVCGDCTLINSDFRGTNSVANQERIINWSCPIYISVLSDMDSVQDGTIFDDLNTLEQAVLSAILKDDVWNNESPYYGIEIESSEPDEETLPPKKSILYRFTVTKTNVF